MSVLLPHGIVVIGEYAGKTKHPAEGEIILHYFVTAHLKLQNPIIMIKQLSTRSLQKLQ
jgi:hypothetical protein